MCTNYVFRKRPISAKHSFSTPAAVAHKKCVAHDDAYGPIRALKRRNGHQKYLDIIYVLGPFWAYQIYKVSNHDTQVAQRPCCGRTMENGGLPRPAVQPTSSANARATALWYSVNTALGSMYGQYPCLAPRRCCLISWSPRLASHHKQGKPCATYRCIQKRTLYHSATFLTNQRPIQWPAADYF